MSCRRYLVLASLLLIACAPTAAASFRYEFVHNGVRDYVGLPSDDPGMAQPAGAVLAVIEFTVDPRITPVTDISQIVGMGLVSAGEAIFGNSGGGLGPVTICENMGLGGQPCFSTDPFIRDDGSGLVFDMEIRSLEMTHYAWQSNTLYNYDLGTEEYSIHAYGNWLRPIPEPAAIVVWLCLGLTGGAVLGIRRRRG